MKTDNKGGYVKLFRSILEWEWWDDINTFRLYSYLLLSAAFMPYQYKGKKYPAGTLITTLSELSKNTGLSVQATRTSLKKLEKTKEILKKSTNEKTLITIVKWRSFQSVEGVEQQTNNKRITNEQQTNNKPPYEKRKNVIKKEYNKSLSGARTCAREKEKFGGLGEYENVFLSAEEIDSLRSINKREWMNYVFRLSEYMKQTGKTYESHYAVIKAWMYEDLSPAELGKREGMTIKPKNNYAGYDLNKVKGLIPVE